MATTPILLVNAARIFGFVLLAGCPSGAAPQDAGAELGRPEVDLGCYARAQTHIEILNACTTAQSVDKKPSLPLLGRDGKLPPLP